MPQQKEPTKKENHVLETRPVRVSQQGTSASLKNSIDKLVGTDYTYVYHGPRTPVKNIDKHPELKDEISKTGYGYKEEAMASPQEDLILRGAYGQVALALLSSNRKDMQEAGKFLQSLLDGDFSYSVKITRAEEKGYYIMDVQNLDLTPHDSGMNLNPNRYKIKFKVNDNGTVTVTALTNLSVY